MPTPNFVVRLPKPTTDAVKEMARIFGSPNASDFVRQLLVAITSGDWEKTAAFVGKLHEKLTGQMMLDLAAAARKPAKVPRKRPKRGRRAGAP